MNSSSSESIRATTIGPLRVTVGSILFNVSNFPAAAQSRLLGQDMAPLRERLTDAIIESWLPAVVAQVQADEAQAIANLIAGVVPYGAGMDPITGDMDRETGFYVEGVQDAWSAVNARVIEYREKGDNNHE